VNSHNIVGNKEIFCACLLAAAGALVFNAFPQFLSVIAGQFLMSEAEVGSLISAFMGGFALLSLFAPLWMPRLPWKGTAIAGYLMIGCGVFLLKQISKGDVTNVMFLMGLGSSLLFAISLGILSAAKDPDRGFGLKLTAEMLLGAIFIFFVANIIGGKFGYNGFINGLLALYLLTGLSILWLPVNFLKAKTESNGKKLTNGGVNFTAVFATLALFLFAGAYTGVWGFVTFMGIEHGLHEEGINSVLTLALLSGICGALLCAWMGKRFGQLLPLLGGMLVMVIAIILLIYGNNLFIFGLAVCLINAFLQFVLAYQMGLVTQVDLSGRYVVMLAFVLSLSATLSGGIMGIFIESAGINKAMLGSVGAVIVAMLITFFVLQRESIQSIDGSQK